MKLLKLFLFLAIICVTGNVYAQNSSTELRNQRDAIQKEIDLLNKSLQQTSSNKRLSQRQINEINARIRLRQAKINTMTSEIRLLDNQISDNINTVSSLQSQLNKLKKGYAAMVLFAYRNQSAYSKLMFVFAANDFNQAYKRLKYLQQFGEYRKKQARSIEGTQKELKVKIVELDHNKKEKSIILHTQEKEKQLQIKERASQTKVLSNLTKQEKQITQDISRRKQDAARLNRLISAAIEEARRAAEAEARAAAAKAKAEGREVPVAKPMAKGSTILSATPEAAKLSADFLSNRGQLPWPVAAGTIAEEFGMHIYGNNIKFDQRGVEITTNAGAAVRAIFSGEVIAAQKGTGTVLVMHGDYITVYDNLRSVSVSKGQKVSTKQTIGTAATNSSDGTTQIHLEIIKGTTPMDPAIWLARQEK